MNVEEMTLEELCVAACTSDSSQPYLRIAAQAELDRLAFKPLADQWEELKRERDAAREDAKRATYDAAQETIKVSTIKSHWIEACRERDEAREKLSHAQTLLQEMQDALKLAVKQLLGKKDA